MQMRVSQRELDRQPSLRAPDVYESAIARPRELLRDRTACAHAEPGHRLQEAAGALGIPVECGEQILAMLDLILRFPGAERRGQMSPEWIQAAVRHLQHPADIGRLITIEKHGGIVTVGIDGIAAGKESKRHQGVKKVPMRARMEVEASSQRIRIG